MEPQLGARGREKGRWRSPSPHMGRRQQTDENGRRDAPLRCSPPPHWGGTVAPPHPPAQKGAEKKPEAEMRPRYHRTEESQTELGQALKNINNKKQGG